MCVHVVNKAEEGPPPSQPAFISDRVEARDRLLGLGACLVGPAFGISREAFPQPEDGDVRP